MYDIFRDSAIGYCLRLLTFHRVALYPEQRPSFKTPESFTEHSYEESAANSSALINESKSQITNRGLKEEDWDEPELERKSKDRRNGLVDGVSSPDRVKDSHIVSWYADDDPDNPHNWSPLKKAWLSFVILLYTFTVYIGSSLYVASITSIVETYKTSETVASLGLSFYVLGYGLGPLILAPLSEIPAIGRNPPYIFTFLIFVLLCIPTCLIDDIAGLLVLRFLLGLFGSPALATGGASYGDFYGDKEMPYVIALWGGGATLGPVSLCIS